MNHEPPKNADKNDVTVADLEPEKDPQGGHRVGARIHPRVNRPHRHELPVKDWTRTTE